MRKLVCLLGLIFLVSLTAAAQDGPKAELFGGYSYIRSGGTNFHGWNASAAGNLNHWFGIVGDFSGHYYSLDVLGTSVSTSIYAYTFGPQFSYRANDKIVPFARVLVGGARIGAETTIAGVSVSASENGFATNVGGGVDWVASPSVAIRLIQADALITRFSGSTSTDGRLSFGVVFRFNR